ncbi:MAG TPA: TIGR00366 family protein [Candidatus Limnocylindrales bacterium]|nr:TIGR00366 family protein [Candidatus Limnocylindrales bacterium]
MTPSTAPRELDTADLTPVQRLGEAIADRAERWMPGPFLFAIILTYVTALGAFVSEGSGPIEVAEAWYGGFWSLLTFAMQMVVILATGTVVAHHPRVRAGILRLVRIPKTGRQAVVLVALGAMLAAWVSWGLSLILGAILAREMGQDAARRGVRVHYPLLAVAGYMGIGLNWGWGMTSSPGLLQATEGNVLMEMGFVDRVIPATEWVFHPYPLTLTALALVYAPIVLWLLCPPPSHARGIEVYVPGASLAGATPAETSEAKAPEPDPPATPADRIDNSRILGGGLALVGVALSARVFLTEGLGALDLNVINFAFLMVGLLLFLSPARYEKDFYKAIQGCAGIIMLYPFYAGIIGIMTGTGLVDTIAQALLSLADADTFPVIAWITAGALNVFIPSAGGEWAVVGGPMMLAGAELGIPHGQTIAAYVSGDSHTNLLNPFWALPLLAITGLRARDMFGYAITMLLLLTPFLALVLYFLPY